MISRTSGLVALAVSLVGCGSESEPKQLTWQGSANHLRAVGNLNGETIDVDLSDPTASDTAQLWCEREWEVPTTNTVRDYASGRMVEFRVDGFFDVGGIPHSLELEFKKHDFQSDAIGTTTTVIPRDDAVAVPADQMWLEWEWHDVASDSTVYEAAAQTGTVTLELFEGTVDTSGLIIPPDTGRIGGVVHARWSQTDAIDMSFTVSCKTNKIVEVTP